MRSLENLKGSDLMRIIVSLRDIVAWNQNAGIVGSRYPVFADSSTIPMLCNHAASILEVADACAKVRALPVNLDSTWEGNATPHWGSARCP